MRLTPSKISGLNLVEVYHNGEWGTLCDDEVGGSLTAVGQVICRQLGNVTNITSAAQLGYPSSYFDAHGYERIWLDSIDCHGTERNIDNCSHEHWGSHDCGHNEDILVNVHVGLVSIMKQGLYLSSRNQSDNCNSCQFISVMNLLYGT